MESIMSLIIALMQLDSQPVTLLLYSMLTKSASRFVIAYLLYFYPIAVKMKQSSQVTTCPFSTVCEISPVLFVPYEKYTFEKLPFLLKSLFGFVPCKIFQ